MNTSISTRTAILVLAALVAVPAAHAQDWPQWRGPNRDGKAPDFKVPASWPQALTQKWKVNVGLGDSTPSLANGKLFVFARQEGKEVVQCLDADTGKEIWHDGYDALAATGPAGRHPGPRSTPAVAGNSIVAYGVRGMLSCWDAASGKLLWRKDDLKAAPRFFTASSPLIADSLCVAQLGSEDNGGIVAYDLASGDVKWKWTGDGTAYSSPVLYPSGPAKAVAALTAKKVVLINLADGALLWETPFAPQGRAYNAATPTVQGQTLIYAGSGRGTHAVRLDLQDGKWAAKDLWVNTNNSVQFNSPVLAGDSFYALAQNGVLFCLDASSGATHWTAPAPAGSSGFGSIINLGDKALALLTPTSELIIFQPSEKDFEKLASYKVSDSETYAAPVFSGQKVYIKDKDSVALWSFD